MKKHRMLIDLDETTLQKVDAFASKHQRLRKQAVQLLVIAGLNAQKLGDQKEIPLLGE